MNDPSTYWLTFTNAALGIVVLICCVAVAVGVFHELAARRKKRAAEAALDREVAELAGSYTGGYAFHLPKLGPTMADGGEELRKKDSRSPS